MSKKFQAPRGTRDIWAPEVTYWQKFETTARQILGRAVYREIRTPAFEFTELFARGIGEATDIVGKEMYSFTDKKGRSLTLRPEGTAGVVRAYIENRLFAQGNIQRLWYIGSMFRYENPQAGRQRQFHQLGVEVLGSDDPRADVEVIAIAADLLRELGLSDLVVDLNSVGNSEDRQNYRDALVEYFTPFINELDQDSRDRLDRNPLRILDSKVPRTQEIATEAPSILDYLGAASQKHFDSVQTLLNDLGIAYKINPRLVRGLDYYTHTAFEIQSADLGAQSAVCGGGRYDRLVAELGGPDTPAVGWALGIERLTILLQQIATSGTNNLNAIDFYLVSRGDQAEPEAVKIAQKLRHAGFSVEIDLSGSKFDKQMKRANNSGAIAALLLGDREVNDNQIQLKWLASGEQEATSLSSLLAEPEQLRSQLKRAKQQGSD
ncbi:histidyl-tRNA synthetase [Thalassoporum mexicanum PCC 7367]|uniref:histidine--tRNA ligase n=1 Tax=Thalassoporum mexicanum TaxID=3457544 RepID=UPI00029FDC64|nr:histidine--tRNA ligase [Pseudanabaena sp. PCC 7367]AFY71166.1 histidyl-tRNA synthetase [Pseudanabaena sp. PCC 7367]